jgi:hypothetical protein
MVAFVVDTAKVGGPTVWIDALNAIINILASNKLNISCITKIVIASDFDLFCPDPVLCSVPAIQAAYNIIKAAPNTHICAAIIKDDYKPPNGTDYLAGNQPIDTFMSYNFDNGTYHNNDFYNQMLEDCALAECTPKPPPTGGACNEFNDPAVYCQQCMMRRNQLDYYPDPCNCSNYYHCFYNGTQYEGILRPCPPGEKFSATANHCLPTPFNCTDDDPCHNNQTTIDIGFWQYPDECGIYYQCSNYYSVRMCCPPFQSFSTDLWDCEYNPNCTHHNEECGTPGITIPMLSPIIFNNGTRCNDTQYGTIREINPADASSYFVILEGYPEPVLMQCPQNTQFNINSCKCDIFTSARPFATPDYCILNITCDNNPIIDSSVSNNFIDNGGSPQVDSQSTYGGATSACQFNGPSGSGWLEVPYFQGNDVRDKLSACWWVRWDNCAAEGTPANRYTIFSNRGENSPSIGNVPPSILVRTVAGIPPTGSAVSVRIRTTSTNFYEAFSDNIACGEWHHVCFVYDGNTIQIYVNGTESGSPVPTDGKPIFWMNHCPLIIGQDKLEYDARILNGGLDEILWCKRTFSQADIQALYDSQVGDF